MIGRTVLATGLLLGLLNFPAAAQMPDSLTLERCPDPVTEACMLRNAAKLERSFADPAAQAYSQRAIAEQRQAQSPCADPAALIADFNSRRITINGPSGPVMTATSMFNLHASTINDLSLPAEVNPLPACEAYIEMGNAESHIRMTLRVSIYHNPRTNRLMFQTIQHL